MSARDYALVELDGKKLPGWSAHQLRVNRGRVSPPADGRDRALAEQLSVGVVKNLLHLQWLIKHYSQRSLKSVDGVAQKILALGLYQLKFLDRIPTAAAVHEAVEQAKRFNRAKAAGFINAVLRNATMQAAPPPPDREKEAAEFAELMLSHPRALYLRVEKLLGKEKALRFCEHNNAEPPTLVRLYAGAAAAELNREGVTVTEHEEAGVYIVQPARPGLLGDWARRGIAQVQDPTAARVVRQMDLSPGQTVLDRCCGVGTKTLQIRDAIGREGQILAVDPSEARCETFQRMLEQRRLGNVTIRRIGMLCERAADDPREFDRVLIDAPCSNSGVLARRPEARYSQSHDALRSLAQLQDRILDDSAAATKPGGKLIYSTCSVWPEENEHRVRSYLARHADYRLLEERKTWPSLDPDAARYRDGGYFAVLERT